MFSLICLHKKPNHLENKTQNQELGKCFIHFVIQKEYNVTCKHQYRGGILKNSKSGSTKKYLVRSEFAKWTVSRIYQHTL